MIKTIVTTGVMLVLCAIAYAQQANQRPAVNPPVHDVRVDGTLRIKLNGAVPDWLLGANVGPSNATAKVQVFEIDRDFENARWKTIGQGFAKTVSYPEAVASANTIQINGVGSHDTTTIYVEAPAWTTLIVTGPKDEVLYQTPLRKTLLASRGMEFEGPRLAGGFGIVLAPTDKTHEARIRVFQPRGGRSILQAMR